MKEKEGKSSKSGSEKNPNPLGKSNEAKDQPRPPSAAKAEKTEKSKSGKGGKERASHQLTNNADGISNMLDNTSSSSSSSSSRSRSSHSSSSRSKQHGKTKGHTGSGSRTKQKRKVKTVMAQIVKQVRRGKRAPSKSGKSGAKSSKSSASGKVVKSRSSSSTRGHARKKKTSRSLQQMHVLEKSVFRSRLECQNTSTDPMPYQWAADEIAKIGKDAASNSAPLERVNSESSLVGKSIIYHDEVAKGGFGSGAADLKSELGEQSASESLDSDADFLSVEALWEEVSHCESNDIFEPGPFDW